MVGSVIFSCPSQIWNLKVSVRVGRSRPNLKFKIFGEGGFGHLTMSRPNLKFKIYGGGWSSFHVRPNLKFKLFGEVGGQSSFHVQTESKISNFQWGLGVRASFHVQSQIWNLKVSVRVGGPGQIWNSKFLLRVVGSVIFACPGWIQNLKFSVWRWGVSHLFHI